MKEQSRKKQSTKQKNERTIASLIKMIDEGTVEEEAIEIESDEATKQSERRTNTVLNRNGKDRSLV